MGIKRHAEGRRAHRQRLERAARGVEALLRAAIAAEREFAADLKAVDVTMRRSARNLVHYLAVRRHDIRDLQEELARLGLSSLGRMESHVAASLKAVLEILENVMGAEMPADLRKPPALGFDVGETLLSQHAERILGPASGGLDARIMVTMPGEAADDPALIRELVRGGMGIMRINCAHDTPAEWERMVHHLRRAQRETGRSCLVSFDLAGPKLRTGPMAPGPAVAKWRPKRDALGRAIEPARVRFAAQPPLRDDGIVTLPCDAALLARARVGDSLHLADARGRERIVSVIEASPAACLCESDQTAYVVPGTKLVLRRRGKTVGKAEVGELPALAQAITLRAGDRLDVLLGEEAGQDAVREADGRIVEPARVSCALAEVFSGVREGDPILFDDGRIRGVVEDVRSDRLRVEVGTVAGGVAKLRAEKGINLPQSQLDLPALTEKDRLDLDFIATHGDMVALSFVRRPADIADLIQALAERGASRLGIVLKIETQAAFERLPELLLTAMRDPPVAVMVARGDLGVEVGFERLSEVQEQVLWLCEAAHVPVIWATQVLESLAKGGTPSRAEVTDAAMASRAECVMLNKGPYIVETLRFLMDVLGRMEEHQYKKSARLRMLHVSEPRHAPKASARARR